ncbi:hypothetical protein Leryth_026922 [Lithospermum erythrorhizon]|nr:hypothetical protein Leryth_026922 [Lithospermum erythrorhizon]
MLKKKNIHCKGSTKIPLSRSIAFATRNYPRLQFNPREGHVLNCCINFVVEDNLKGHEMIQASNAVLALIIPHCIIVTNNKTWFLMTVQYVWTFPGQPMFPTEDY